MCIVLLTKALTLKNVAERKLFEKSNEKRSEDVKNTHNGKIEFFILRLVFNIFHIANVDNMWVLHLKDGQT